MTDFSDNESVETLHALLAKQKAEIQKEQYVPAYVREDRLDRLQVLLVRYEKDICDALMSDYGYRSADQSSFSEVMTSFKPIKIARRSVRKWMKAERRATGFPFNIAGARAEVQYQPLGVVGIISPWNFPVNLTVTPLAGVLAAGNRAMIKPSELTPATAEVMAKMMAEGFDETEVAVINGGPEVGRAFSTQSFDHLVYTGGEVVAKHIMKAAAENLVPLTLELGGKSPVIIGEKAKLSLAARRILFGKTFNAGQICLAPDYVFVPEPKLQEFIEEVSGAAEESFPKAKGHGDYVSVINDRHADRIKNYVVDAKQNGAEVLELGPWPDASDAAKNIVPITLVINPPEACAISKEEIFGPLLVIRTYKNFDKVLNHINGGPKPLSLYYFGKKGPELKRVFNETSSGGVTVNDVIMHYTMDDLPFGGVGASGMGAYHGFDGFKQFSHARAVYQQSPFDIGGMLRPPYGPSFHKITRLLMKLS